MIHRGTDTALRKSSKHDLAVSWEEAAVYDRLEKLTKQEVLNVISLEWKLVLANLTSSAAKGKEREPSRGLDEDVEHEDDAKYGKRSVPVHPFVQQWLWKVVELSEASKGLNYEKVFGQYKISLFGAREACLKQDTPCVSTRYLCWMGVRGVWNFHIKSMAFAPETPDNFKGLENFVYGRMIKEKKKLEAAPLDTSGLSASMWAGDKSKDRAMPAKATIVVPNQPTRPSRTKDKEREREMSELRTLCEREKQMLCDEHRVKIGKLEQTLRDKHGKEVKQLKAEMQRVKLNHLKGLTAAFNDRKNAVESAHRKGMSMVREKEAIVDDLRRQLVGHGHEVQPLRRPAESRPVSERVTTPMVGERRSKDEDEDEDGDVEDESDKNDDEGHKVVIKREE
ncbi:hypothetical protein ACHAQH_007982 [Verticillium albo-atrum]